MDLLFFYVTGNPGGLEFYCDFLDYIATTLLPKLEFVKPYDNAYLHSICHANHHLLTENEHPTGKDFFEFGLEDQIQHQYGHLMGSLQQRSNSHNQVDIVLCGHSIGCFIILSILDRYAFMRDKCVNVILLMPFIMWKNLPTLHRWQLSLFLQLKPLSLAVVRAFVKLLWWVSPPTRTRLAGLLAAHIEDDSTAYIVAHRLLSLRMVMNFLSMGADEIVDVAAKEQHTMSIIKSLGPLVWALYTPDDKWAPLEDMDELQTTIPGMESRVVNVPGVTHSFTISAEGRRKVGNALVALMNRNSEDNKLPHENAIEISNKKAVVSHMKLLVLSATPLLGLVVKHVIKNAL